ncbi:thiol:disulfide interchange protein DsbA/DsbL [Paraferrimonas haliotis]|uniref:Thiol:disulfide interchange protein n=1 Tax=Paraferrimonas haliotis TaxID=2013866 RepID=A0AA37WXS5_9GAMM|nr:thiol:disulfide interchange protein DsbA/DsbL [Paraferrimonas haliotis]GLS82925.1 thiol:disulfide interchange protein [Paraferrimonas haliotis]
MFKSKMLAVVFAVSSLLMLGACSPAETPAAPAAPAAPTAPAAQPQANVAPAPAPQEAGQFVQGKHYFTVSDKSATATPQITEFFSFYCHNCYNMETQYLPFIKAHIDPSIEFKTAHVDFMRSEIGYEVIRSLAVMQQMGITSELMPTMFATIQADDDGGHHHGHDHGDNADALDIKVNSRDDIKAIFAAKGYDVTQYDSMADSDQTNATMKKWAEQEKAFGIRSVPGFVVNEKYAINMSEIRSLEEFAALINFLALHKS